jgi:GNAT superfamily N-acetyltransferase
MEIREAAATDLDRVRYLMDQAGHPLPDDDGQALWEAVVADPMHDVLVAEVDGTPVGIIDIVLRRHLHHGGLAATVDNLVVDSVHRGVGIGTHLLALGMDRAAQRGARLVELTSGTRRKKAHRFYERLRFKNNGLRFVRLMSSRGG